MRFVFALARSHAAGRRNTETLRHAPAPFRQRWRPSACRLARRGRFAAAAAHGTNQTDWGMTSIALVTNDACAAERTKCHKMLAPRTLAALGSRHKCCPAAATCPQSRRAGLHMQASRQPARGARSHAHSSTPRPGRIGHGAFRGKVESDEGPRTTTDICHPRRRAAAAHACD